MISRKWEDTNGNAFTEQLMRAALNFEEEGRRAPKEIYTLVEFLSRYIV
jgi:hypothetical protein